MLHEMRFPAILEIEFQIFQNSRLIAFDGEMVMRLALGDQIVGQLALRRQGIGTDLLARNLDGLEQWDGGLDLVGAFGFFLFLARYWQGAHFFGCSKFCSDDRRRSSHEFADLAHPGRCTSSCRRWPDSHLPRHRLRSSVARTGPDARG